jgi:hypothetical protein
MGLATGSGAKQRDRDSIGNGPMLPAKITRSTQIYDYVPAARARFWNRKKAAITLIRAAGWSARRP